MREGIQVKRQKIYLIGLLALSLFSVLLVRRWWNSPSLFVRALRSDLQSEIPAYEPHASLFDFIANRSWIDITGHARADDISIEGDLWKFYGDGRFEYSLITDYDYDLEGTWRLVDFGNSQGLLYLSYTATPHSPNEVASAWKKHVVFIEAENKHLNFDFHPFWGKDIRMTAENSTNLTVDSAYIQKDFPTYSLLLGKRWIKDNDVQKDWIPHELTFFEDGTFYASYVRDAPCNFTGNWSISESAREGIDIRFSAPNARCDSRGYKGFSWSAHYLLTDTNLINANSNAYDYHVE
jgi:hypothetical protein